jgi:very-short-patch-repair endonuclease
MCDKWPKNLRSPLDDHQIAKTWLVPPGLPVVAGARIRRQRGVLRVGLMGSSKPGYQLLRQFVLFAAASGDRDVNQLGASDELNPFELDVHERLVAAGLQVDTQYGVAGYRLDFAIRHPHDPSRHVLAVETDGATYHSGWTARERDRLRQQHLESLGWRFHRIWSTDYWRDPEAEMADVLASVQTAVERLASRLPAADDPPVVAINTHRSSQTADPNTSPPRSVPGWVVSGRPINTYTDQQLVELVRWLRRDGALRLHDDEIRLLMTALGITRRSPNIASRLEQAIGRAGRA